MWEDNQEDLSWGGSDKRILGVCWPASPAKLANSKCSESSSQRRQCEEQSGGQSLLPTTTHSNTHNRKQNNANWTHLTRWNCGRAALPFHRQVRLRISQLQISTDLVSRPFTLGHSFTKFVLRFTRATQSMSCPLFVSGPL